MFFQKTFKKLDQKIASTLDCFNFRIVYDKDSSFIKKTYAIHMCIFCTCAPLLKLYS